MVYVVFMVQSPLCPGVHHKSVHKRIHRTPEPSLFLWVVHNGGIIPIDQGPHESQSKPGIGLVYPKTCKGGYPQLFLAGIVPYYDSSECFAKKTWEPHMGCLLVSV